MEIDLSSMDLEQLRSMFLKAETELANALIDGASWQEVKDKREIYTSVAKEFYRKKYPSENTSPADTPFRND
jgi:hypothetical protein